MALTNWFNGGITGKDIVFTGDSTTSNAPALFNELNGFYTDEGEALYGVGPIYNHGENGCSLEVFLNDGVTHGITDIIASQADLYVFSFGTNDVRLGLTSEATLIALLNTAIDAILAGVPTGDVVLWIPPSYLTTDVDDWGWVVPNSAAQEYTDICWNAFKAVEGNWPTRTVMVDTQTLIFGRVCQPSSPFMRDQIHPGTEGNVRLAKDLVDVMGVFVPFDKAASNAAMAANPAAPWEEYARVVEDPEFFRRVSTGRWVTSSVQGFANGYVDWDWPGERANEIIPGEHIVQMAQETVFAIPANALVTALSTWTRLYSLGNQLPPATITGSTVNVYAWVTPGSRGVPIGTLIGV